jgi:type IV pilus assembly protein PilO
MNEFFDQILQRPRPQKIAILAVLIILLLAGDFFYFYAPQADEISRLTDDIENARVDKDRKQKLAANQPKLEKDLRDLDAMLKEAVAQLPDRKEIPELLKNISTKAKEAGLEILLFRPRGEVYRDFYAEIPVDILVKGNFYNVVSFFDEVGQLSRLVNINNIDFKNPKVAGDEVVLETSTLATTFRFLDDAERKKIAAEKAKAAKK